MVVGVDDVAGGVVTDTLAVTLTVAQVFFMLCHVSLFVTNVTSSCCVSACDGCIIASYPVR